MAIAVGDRSRDSKNELLSSNTRDKEGAFMYMMAAERQQKCWAGVCANEALCQPKFLGCASLAIPGREAWLASTVGAEDFSVDNFNYGIFNVGMANNTTATNFITRYFYSLWLCLLGLRYIVCYLNHETFVEPDFCRKMCVHLCLQLQRPSSAI